MKQKVTTVVVAPQLTEQLTQQVAALIEIADFWQIAHGKNTYAALKAYLQTMQRSTAASEDFVSHYDSDDRNFFMHYMQDLEKVTKLLCKLPLLVAALEQTEPIAQTA